MKKPLGAQIPFILKENGVEIIFGIPGVHNIELYRGIEEAGLKHILARHEQGAGFMADGYARATGKPGIAFVITGPGLCNIMTPMGQAYSDSVPMLVISSCLNHGDHAISKGRLHEMKDQEAAAETVCEWSKTALDVSNVYDLLNKAFYEFSAKRPRSKHIQIPIELLASKSESNYKFIRNESNSLDQTKKHEEIAQEIEKANRLIVIVGGGAKKASNEIRLLLKNTNAASFSTYAGRGIINDDNDFYYGATLSRPDSRNDFAKADLILAIGTTLSEVDLWREELGHSCKLIRVDIDPDQLSDQHRSDVKIMADCKTFVKSLNSKLRPEYIKSKWKSNEIQKRRALFKNQVDLERPGIVPFVEALKEVLSEDTIIYSDMTQFAYVAKEVFPMYQPNKWHHPYGFGTLGYALPAAIGGKVGKIDQPILAIMGDYGFQYTLSELGVAVEHKLNIPIIVWDNYKLKEIEDSMVHSQIEPNSVVALNPDFCRLAEAYGAQSSRPNTLDEFKAAIKSAFASSLPTVIHLKSSIADNLEQ